ncbi:hypothetical protein DPM33_28395 [Mesorhizobium hawassense]|uniref:Glycosyltransferase RgtA/B/C/D-like domain-containing protein n=1 Tax=Mesorhizobium hawassense TaxID=1209954 RepID=A0A330HDE4_9HYPH|nr:hypothetical protein [Mesorhizobium hawassense]RAZ85638.1 hypothetical protein DPM33_28395 [Mesorhizobium hawassense]
MPTEAGSARAPGQEQSSGLAQRSTLRDFAIAILLGLAAFVVFNANMRSIPAGDTYAARYLPFSIWRNHSLLLDPIVDVVAQGRQPPAVQGKGSSAYWILKGRDGHFVSQYPLAVPVMIAPAYLPVIKYLQARNWNPLLLDRVARAMEKLCASLLAAASVALFYLLLRRRSTPRIAALLTLLYAFGTTTWVISSQALWMHGLAELLVVVTMLLITGRCSPARAAAAGFLCALIAVNRQPDAVLAASLGLYGLWWAGRRIPLLVIAGLIPVGLVVAYNLDVVGNLAGAYALVGRSHDYNYNVIEGIAGLLFSPMRGLFVFSPFLLFVPLFLAPILRDAKMRGLTIAMLCAIVVQVVLYAFVDWRQGVSWGPRWLTDFVPMLIWMLPPVLAAQSPRSRAAFALAGCVAIAIQAIGAFWYTGASDNVLIAATGADKMRAAWDINNAAFIAELRHPPAPMDLFAELAGSVDQINVIQIPPSTNVMSRRVEALGWALVDRKTPLDVAVSVDGQPMGGTVQFFERSDVVKALGSSNPAGWRVAFPANQLGPGEHILTARVRAQTGSVPRLLVERKFSLAPDAEMMNVALKAEQALAGRLQAPGYWLTSFTSGLEFVKPHPELNTYLNSLVLDVMTPVAKEAGIEDTLVRVRRYLSDQIEPDGLVRYHGRPDAPTIGKLGCAITPDADDTALVWRAAPGKRTELLSKALATLDQYKRPDGLYRTWLAPRERYQCLDPGKDPNPADLGIQMHVYMLLARQDPAAAQALCEAMARKANDDDVWVYYAKAPLLLALRLADLRKAGCKLKIAPSRLQSAVPGQDIWIRVAELIGQTENGDATGQSRLETAQILGKIAENDFSLLNSAPPLFYHNDLSATVRRFYWSQELGYALWLRLYFANQSGQTTLSCRPSGPEQKCGEI